MSIITHFKLEHFVLLLCHLLCRKTFVLCRKTFVLLMPPIYSRVFIRWYILFCVTNVKHNLIQMSRDRLGLDNWELNKLCHLVDKGLNKYETFNQHALKYLVDPLLTIELTPIKI